MKKILIQTLGVILLLFFLILPYLVFAQNPALNTLTDVGNSSGYNPDVKVNSVPVIVGTVIRAFLSLLGVIFIILMIYGGYHWMTAAGDEQKVDKAKETIKRAIIGLVIVIGSYAIWMFVAKIL